MLRLRLVDTVAIAAGAMLCLRLLTLASGSHALDDSKRQTDLKVAAEQSRAFAQALANARSNAPDVSVTGATDKALPAKPEPAKPDAAKPAEATAEPPSAMPQNVSPAERAILERLGERREEWQQKGRDLDMREKLLENAEKKLEARINELKSLEQKSETDAAKRGDTEAGALKNLVIMYEAMKPKEAARIFDRLNHEVLVPVVQQMNPRKMSEILAVMSPEAAERLTIALAQRGKAKAEASAKPGLPPTELPAIEPGRN